MSYYMYRVISMYNHTNDIPHILKKKIKFLHSLSNLSVSAISDDITCSRRALTLKFNQNLDLTKIHQIKYKTMNFN